MRTDLDHLPEGKRRELDAVVSILFEAFEAKTRARSQPHLKQGRILKIVLFGSYARGDWAGSGARPTAPAATRDRGASFAAVTPNGW